MTPALRRRLAAAATALGPLAAALPLAPLPAQGLFKATAPVTLTVTTDLKTFLRVRDSTELVAHEATIAWSDSGRSGTVAARMRARGHFRRQARNCGFPPVRWQITRAAAQGSLFQGNRKVEVTTTCRPGNATYDQYILREYALYQAYQVLTPWSHRTRLARVTWADSGNRVKPVQSWAFLIEDPDELGERRDAAEVKTDGVRFEEMDGELLGIAALYQWLVANHDWSVGARHNVRLFQRPDSTSGRIPPVFPVIYDFDFSGAVDASYALPPPQLRLSSVRDRLYRGDCRSAEQWAPIVARFKERRAAMDSTIAAVPGIDPRWVASTRAYFDKAYALMDTPPRMVKDFAFACDKGN